ncbi:MAG: phosphatidylserine decarboxylase [Gammaproteobacteria bacterium]
MIAREGWPLILVSVAVAGIATWRFGWLTGLPFWVWVVVASYLFRDPRRKVPALPLAVVSPVDGIVESIVEVDDPCLERRAQRVSICMGVFGAYSLRAPIEGKVVQRRIDRFTGHRCDADAGNDDLDDLGVWIQTDEEDDVVLLIPGGKPLRNPRFYVHAGERVGQGQRCGFIRFGSRVDVLLPLAARVQVAPGERVRSGETVLAMLVHEAAKADPGVSQDEPVEEGLGTQASTVNSVHKT